MPTNPLTRDERDRMRELLEGAMTWNRYMTIESTVGRKALRALADLDAKDELLREVLKNGLVPYQDFRDGGPYERIRTMLEGGE